MEIVPMILSFLQIYFLVFIFYTVAILTTFILDYIESVFLRYDIEKQNSFFIMLQIILRLSINISIVYYLIHFLINLLSNYVTEEKIQKSSMIFVITCVVYDTYFSNKVAQLKLRYQRLMSEFRKIQIKNQSKLSSYYIQNRFYF